ncbi:type III pantothenate kinase [Coraliomargarita sinensis]|uniref:Type III pantothenate kinase n=1 Tax=Coraliomargarita sinensis TaxID=2174842 RepID=A0A317ZMS7_9BACT|nr:type III pantothenate kinase [Coraliomargarita sinensis]PXA05487.1 type III pantothenate kinase [Coraliomargarita sinensis]
MKTLCIDVGNTSTHYGVVNGRAVSQVGHFPTAGLQEGPSREFYEILAPLSADIASIAFCSVVPAVNANLKASLADAGRPIFQLTHESCQGLDLVYPKPEEIGQDRIANAIAAQEYYGTPAVVIDMGTAVTFDIISDKGYEGGIIAPGLAIMRTYLHDQTALLPELSEADLVKVEGAIGKSTVHAMQLGVAIGFSGMIDALLTRVREQLRKSGGGDPIVLSTGGSVANLTRDWAEKSEFVENLTLLGLAVAARRAGSR